MEDVCARVVNVDVGIGVRRGNVPEVEALAAFRGDTAQGGTKPATLETGLRVTVPMFITPGTRIRVDTRSGEYTERVS